MTERTIEDSIEASSLGTPEAKALRASVSDTMVAGIVARVRQLDEIRVALREDPGFGELDVGRRIIDVAVRLGADPLVVRREWEELCAPRVVCQFDGNPHPPEDECQNVREVTP